MKELRELYEISKQENWIPDSHDNHIYAPCGRYMLRVAHVTRIADARLIAAMHNALPELLDAWEMVQAMKWANDIYRQPSCNPCPFSTGTCDGGHCYHFGQHADEWLQAWRDAYADTKAD